MLFHTFVWLPSWPPFTNTVQFSSVQSLSRVRLFATLHKYKLGQTKAWNTLTLQRRINKFSMHLQEILFYHSDELNKNSTGCCRAHYGWGPWPSWGALVPSTPAGTALFYLASQCPLPASLDGPQVCILSPLCMHLSSVWTEWAPLEWRTDVSIDLRLHLHNCLRIWLGRRLRLLSCKALYPYFSVSLFGSLKQFFFKSLYVIEV